uniref:Mads box protein n=1 Tax=Solanum tuberosum TaxID=4113 RepID=M1DWA1_SOLTU
MPLWRELWPLWRRHYSVVRAIVVGQRRLNVVNKPLNDLISHFSTFRDKERTPGDFYSFFTILEAKGVNPRQQNHNNNYYNKAIVSLISKQTHFSYPLSIARNKVKYALIEDASKTKISSNKRLKGLLKKSDDLKTLCDVEVATVIYGPYRNERFTFPNNDVVRNTFIKFKELPTLERSKNMVTRKEFIMQRIKKLEEQLQKVRKENMVKEMTNEMYEVFKRKNVSVDMNPFDLNNLRCVIKKNLKKVHDLMIKENDEEGSTSNVPQPISEPMVPSRNNSEEPRDPSPLLFSQMFPAKVPQLFSPMPQNMAVGRPHGLTPPMPSTIMDSPIPSPMMDSLMPSPIIDSLMP